MSARVCIEPGIRAFPLLIVLGLSTISLLSCTPNRPYRTDNPVVNVPLGEGKSAPVAYVEFDEQGDLWQPERDTSDQPTQFERAVGLIKNTRTPLLVIYIHGWQNNADPKSGDVMQFNNAIRKLATTERVRSLNYDVVGVYIGWRGKHAYDPLFKNLSFDKRKTAAIRLGNSLPLTETIFRLVHEARTKDRPGAPSRAVLVGHSFGALVLERALQQALAGTLVAEQNPRRPADFVLLVNSAGEAFPAKTTRDMLKRTFRVDPEQKCYKHHSGAGRCAFKTEPWIVSVTSETDRATGSWFRVGTTVFGLGKLFRTYPARDANNQPTRISQREFFTTTQGHNRWLIDHKVEPADFPKERPRPIKASAFEENLAHPQAIAGEGGRVIQVFATGAGPSGWQWWKINPLVPQENESPFWIVRVDKGILSGHGNIFNAKAVDMMAALFRCSNVIERDQSPAPEIEIKKSPGEAQELKKGVVETPAVPRSPREIEPAMRSSADFNRSRRQFQETETTALLRSPADLRVRPSTESISPGTLLQFERRVRKQ